MRKYIDALSNNLLFSGITQDTLLPLLDALGAYSRGYSDGETVLHTGDYAKRFGIILDGEVKILKEDFEGNSALLARLSAGESFAETFVYAKMPLTVTVQSASRSYIMWIDYDKLHSDIGSYSKQRGRMSENLTEIFARKNIFLTGRIEHLSKRTLRERVMSYLSEQAVRAGNRKFKIPLDRRDMADYLSADRSALSAVLCRLRDEGVIEFHKNEFILK